MYYKGKEKDQTRILEVKDRRRIVINHKNWIETCLPIDI